jgi:hypothetical protein
MEINFDLRKTLRSARRFAVRLLAPEMIDPGAFGQIVPIGIAGEQMFSPADFEENGHPAPVMIELRERLHQSVQPLRLVVTEYVSMHYAACDREQHEFHMRECVDKADDLVLNSMFFGAQNVFPSAPSKDTGIPCACLQPDSLGGLMFPKIISGCDVHASFLIEPTVLGRARGNCLHCNKDGGWIPSGYGRDPVNVKVKVRMSIFAAVIR